MKWVWSLLVIFFLMGPGVSAGGFPRAFEHFTFLSSWEQEGTVEYNSLGGDLVCLYMFNFSVHDLQFPTIRVKRMAIDSNCLYLNDSWVVVAYVRNETRHDLYRLTVADSSPGLVDLPVGNYTLMVRLTINSTLVEPGEDYRGALQLSLVDESEGVDEPWYFFMSFEVLPLSGREDETSWDWLHWGLMVVVLIVAVAWVVWSRMKPKSGGNHTRNSEGGVS